MIRFIIALLVFPLFASSFNPIDRGTSEYDRLKKMELRALRNAIGKSYIYNLTRRKDCNKTRIKYLGVVHTKQGKLYKILTTFFVFSASSTCHGSSSIKIFDMHNRYIGEYNVGMPENLPSLLQKNRLYYSENTEDCNLRKTISVNLSNGLPIRFFIPCSKNGGDEYSFSSAN